MRPATIVGDSRSGEVDRFDGPYLLILLVVTSPPDLALPLPGPGEEALNLVPIDWVARASVALGRDERARGRTFHLVDPQPFTTRKVFELVARAGGRRGPRGSIPANLAKALLRAPGLERIAKSPRALLETLTTPVTYEAHNSDELLASLGVPSCPPLESYVEKLVEYVKEHVRRRRATKVESRRSRGPPWVGSPCPHASATGWSYGGSSCARATSYSSRASWKRARASQRSLPSMAEISSSPRPRPAPPSSTRSSTPYATSWRP